MVCFDATVDKRFEKISNQHPCFSGKASMSKGRVHLPVSHACNITCRFCRRSLNKDEQRPGVAREILTPQKAADLVEKAVQLCPDITVVGIAGPGDTLATPDALETFQLINTRYPQLINCLSTNGLLLERYAQDLWAAGVKTVTVTVNAVFPEALQQICSSVLLDGRRYHGLEAARILIGAQKRGIKKMAELGALIKINIVLIPGINDTHIYEIARTVRDLGAAVINIIPLIPQHELAAFPSPTCDELNRARETAEELLPVFRHCRHCRADACGIPGKADLAAQLYEFVGAEQTFSHG
jgi:nitrogen fixation protein NifB